MRINLWGGASGRIVILNALSVLAAFVAFLRTGVALLVLVLGVALWRRRGGADPLAAERRYNFLFILSATLLLLAVVSWPLLYLVLQSYVPQWAGVMCIEGVTRIGSRSVGAPAALPPLVDTMEITKPALIFLAGVWFLLHLLARQEPGAGLPRRALGALLLCGLVAAAGGVAELAYLFIPKQEQVLSAGCCTVGADAVASAGDERFVRSAAGAAQGGSALPVAFFVLAGALVVVLTLALRRMKRGGQGAWLPIALGGALVSLPLGLAFLKDVAAPAFLGLPYHHCAYCLVAVAPESIVGILLYVLGAFGVGWACAARWAGGTPAAVALGPRLLAAARFGYAGALLMAVVGLLVAP